MIIYCPASGWTEVLVLACHACFSYADRIPKPGETVIGHTFRAEFGGKAANQAVMAARLGARIAMIGKVITVLRKCQKVSYTFCGYR